MMADRFFTEGKRTAEIYTLVGLLLGGITGLVVFLGCWWYCTATYGFLWGFGFGWLPSAMAAFISAALVRYLWPLILAAIVAGVLLSYRA